jgi:XapX domain-containing protein
MDIPLFLLSLFAGTLLGVAFSISGLPIPAPPNLAGVTGIIGVYVGFKLVQNLDLIQKLIGL